MATGDTLAPASTTVQGNYYVATNGSNSNPGTISQPFRTIAKGVSMLTPGKTLLVRSGTYAESLQGTIPGGTSWSSPVTVEAYPGETVTLQPPSGAGCALHFQGSNEQYIIVQGFIIDAKNVTTDAIKITSGSGTAADAANHIKITNCEVENAIGQGIITTDGANYNQFINLNVHGNGGVAQGAGSHDSHGMYISTAYNTISGCTIYDNGGRGIQLCDWGTPDTVNNNVVTGNRVYDNGLNNDGGGPGISVASGDNNIISNNVVYGNSDGGIQIEYYAPANNQVVNNTVVNNPGPDFGGIYIGPATSGGAAINTLVENNISYNNTGPGNFTDLGASTTKITNLFGINPLFVNMAGNDFQLQAGSPAINVGTAANAPSTDVDGVPRPQGAGVDIGAYN